MKWKRYGALLALASLAFACGDDGQAETAATGEKSSETHTIGFSVAQAFEFHTCTQKAMEKRADELGYKMIVANAMGSADKEVSNVEDLLARDIDLLVLFAVDADSGHRVIELAQEKDVPVLLTASIIAEPPDVLGAVAFDTEAIGKAIGDWTAEDIRSGDDDQVQIGLIEGLGPAADLFTAGFKEGVEPLGDRAEIVFAQSANYDPSLAQGVAEDMIQAYPDLDYIFVHNEEMGFGVLEGLRGSGVADGDVKIVTQGGTDRGIEELKNGGFVFLLDNTPFAQGTLVIEAAKEYFDTGGLDPAIKLIPFHPITVENVDEAPAYCG